MTLLDMDGVLFDFIGAARRIWPGLPPDADWPRGSDDLEGILGVTMEQFWAPIDAAGPEWWATIEPYPWARDLVLAASLRPGAVSSAARSGSAFAILTSPCHSPHSHAGKALALQRFFGWHFRDYSITPRKHKRLLAAPGRVLVDDHDRTIREWRKAGGVGILFPRPWNSAHAEAADPAANVIEQMRAHNSASW